MKESEAVRLDLRAPLEYAENAGLDPFGSAAGEGEASRELLFCFEVDGEQAGRIDPEAERFLGELVFSGMADAEQGGAQPNTLILPAGLYLFAQRRRFLGREECIGLAMEQQKDGLWERHRLDSRLYIRRLFEDSSEVTQIFRPLAHPRRGGA
jgi:hypothetical protein